LIESFIFLNRRRFLDLGLRVIALILAESAGSVGKKLRVIAEFDAGRQGGSFTTR
jgi:hypothetical protein